MSRRRRWGAALAMLITALAAVGLWAIPAASASTTQTVPTDTVPEQCVTAEFPGGVTMPFEIPASDPVPADGAALALDDPRPALPNPSAVLGVIAGCSSSSTSTTSSNPTATTTTTTTTNLNLNLNLNLDLDLRVDGDDNDDHHDGNPAGVDHHPDDGHQYDADGYGADHADADHSDDRARRAAQAADELVADPGLQAAVEEQDQTPPLVEQAEASHVQAQAPHDGALQAQGLQAAFHR